MTMNDYAAYEAYRNRAVASLRGHVLEIGAGRGERLALMSAGAVWQGLEPDRRRFGRLNQLARRRHDVVEPVRAFAEDIPLPEASVDGVLAVTALCSVTDPACALSEVRRILRSGGRFVFAEHVAAPTGTWTRAVQRAIAPVSRRLDHGCDPLRETEATIRGSGLDVLELRRFELPQLLGVKVPFVVGVAER